MSDYSLAPPNRQCAVCGADLEWCVGGVRCTDEHNTEKHNESNDTDCILCGLDAVDCSCGGER